MMNKPQRIFLPSALVVGALGVHLWFCEWGWRRGNGEGSALKVYTSDQRCDYQYAVLRSDGSGYERGLSYDAAKQMIRAEEEARRANPTPESLAFEKDSPLLARSLGGMEFEGLPIDKTTGQVMLSSNLHQTLAVWPRSGIRKDDALLFGILAPVGVLAVAVFVSLGGLRSKPKVVAEPASEPADSPAP